MHLILEAEIRSAYATELCVALLDVGSSVSSIGIYKGQSSFVSAMLPSIFERGR